MLWSNFVRKLVSTFLFSFFFLVYGFSFFFLVLIREGDDENEFLTVQAQLGDKSTRIITGYGVQEKENYTKRAQFFAKLKDEICSAEISGCSIFIELDAISKVGPNLIPGDPHEQSDNGKMLAKLIEDHDLVLVNGSEICKGLITRRRKTINSIEESIIDFVIVSRDLYLMLTSLVIDEERKHVLTRYGKENGKNIVKESDHHVLISEFNIK